MKEFGDEVNKKWIYLERNTLNRQCMGISESERAPKYGVVSFYGINFIG